jgi:hypothetical protein
MRSTGTQLVLFSQDEDLVRSLQQFFSNSPNISVVAGNGPEVTALCGLDALWFTWMEASSLVPVHPIPVHAGKVFTMPSAQRAKGLPGLFIAGAALAPNDPRTKSYLAHLCVTSLIGAVERYNEDSSQPIVRIGSTPENLLLDKIETAEAVQVIKEAFESTGTTHLQTAFSHRRSA